MASTVLYPPIVDGYIPAIIPTQPQITIPFVFSKFNAASAAQLILDGLNVQATVCEVVSNQTAVNTSNSNIYAATGIILNLPITTISVEEGTYQISIPTSVNSVPVFNFAIGKQYKIQLRFSDETYSPSSGGTIIEQADWLSLNASHFSEWSTICVVKSTSLPTIQFKNPAAAHYTGIDFKNSGIIGEITYNTENILYFGNFISNDPGEYLTSYKIQLYTSYNSQSGKLSNLYDESGLQEINDSTLGDNTFNFELKKEVNDGIYYGLFTYQTNNYLSDSLLFKITVELAQTTCDVCIETIDSNNDYIDYTSLGMEQEEGRIALFIKPYNTSQFVNATYRIKRYSNKDMFSCGEVIAEFEIPDPARNTSGFIGPIYDTTIESDILYKYGIQKQITESSGITYSTSVKTNIIIRSFEYSYLLGYNKDFNEVRQMKLNFNHNVGNYDIKVNDSQSETLGSKYAYITRNGKTNYKQFSINGLISFNSDENYLFATENEIYGITDDSDPTAIEIKTAIANYKSDKKINFGNDYYYEKKFREFILNFLYDDKVRLYKSPTEGNILVRLTNVSCTPNQSLNNIIYDFSATAYQIADENMENYNKYKIYNSKLVLDNSLLHVIS